MELSTCLSHMNESTDAARLTARRSRTHTSLSPVEFERERATRVSPDRKHLPNLQKKKKTLIRNTGQIFIGLLTIDYNNNVTKSSKYDGRKTNPKHWENSRPILIITKNHLGIERVVRAGSRRWTVEKSP